MIAIRTLALAAVMFAPMAGLCQAQGQSIAKDKTKAKVELPASVTVISPIYGQLVRFSMPSSFVTAFENTKENFYIREAVPRGETVNAWTQMITVTGGKGQAGTPNFSAQGFAASMAGGFKRACPDSFAVKAIGPARFGDHDAFVAVAGCGKLAAGADARSELVMIVAVKGASDAYTVQWAERGPASPQAIIDEAKWQGRLRELMPIRLCAIVAGEAMPYPSCLQQK